MSGIPAHLDANPVPKPFGFTGSNEVVERWNIRLDIYCESPWQLVPEFMIGSRTSNNRKVAFAKVFAPPLYEHVINLDATVEPDWRYWNKKKWENVTADMFGKTVGEVFQSNLPQTRCVSDYVFLARVSDKNHPQMIKLPLQHRQVYPGEGIRRGDLFVDLHSKGWQEVPQTAQRVRIPMPSEQNDFVRFCRRTGANFKNWFVDEQAGAKGAKGSMIAPFPSREYAIKRIIKQAKSKGGSPCGMIWTTQGVPLHAFDIPEPPLDLSPDRFPYGIPPVVAQS